MLHDVMEGCYTTPHSMLGGNCHRPAGHQQKADDYDIKFGE